MNDSSRGAPARKLSYVNNFSTIRLRRRRNGTTTAPSLFRSSPIMVPPVTTITFNMLLLLLISILCSLISPVSASSTHGQAQPKGQLLQQPTPSALIDVVSSDAQQLNESFSSADEMFANANAGLDYLAYDIDGDDDLKNKFPSTDEEISVDVTTLIEQNSEWDVKNLRANDYRPDICRNSLIPFIWNFTANPPTRNVLRTALRVLVGETVHMAFALNASALCPYAVITFGAFNTKAIDVFLTDGPAMPYFNVTARQMANVTVYGKLISYSAIKITVRDPLTPDNVTLYSDCADKLTSCRFIAVCYFNPTVGDQIYDLITLIFTVFCQLDIGLRTKWSHVASVVKSPLSAILGLSCHFIIMPLLAFAMARIIEIDSAELSMGFFFTGIVAGGGLSNLHTRVLGGDFQLSCIMTYASLILSLGFTPMWVAIFEPLIVPPGYSAQVPFDKIAITILEMLIPAVVGFVFRHFFPKYGFFVQKFIVYPVVVLLFLYYCTYGLYTYQWMFQLFTPSVVLCGCLLPYFGFILSGLIALACRQPLPMVITIMMETSFQNVSLAMSIIRLSISDKIIQTLTLVGPYSVLIFSQVPIVAAELVVFTKTRCIPRIKQRMSGKVAHTRLEDDGLLDPDAYGELSESNNPVSGSQVDIDSDHLSNASDETKRFFERKKDYFGKELAS